MTNEHLIVYSNLHDGASLSCLPAMRGWEGNQLTLMPLLTTDRYDFFFDFFFADLSYVGFVLVGNVLDIKQCKINFSPMDLFSG